MAITYYTTDKQEPIPAGHEYVGEYATPGTGSIIHVYTKLHGTVVNLYERNGYDDSDFYAVCFVDGQEYVEQYASTRYWSGPCAASIDATPELIKAWHQFRKDRDAATEKQIRELERREQQALADKFIAAGMTDQQIERWFERKYKLSEDVVAACEQLLKTLKFRSNFRESMRNQIIDWLDEAQPRYTVPLSPKQLAAVAV